MTLSDQQVLVTGATGFLGGALALRLAADGARVRALARSARKADFLRERGIEVFEGDVTDRRQPCAAAAQGCRVVFHVAAALGGSYAQQRAVNVEGTRNVAAGGRTSPTSSVSSTSAASRSTATTTAGDVTEEMALAPGADPYAITKAEAERVVRASDIPYTIIRPGMIYGAGSVNWTGNLFRLARLNPTPFVGSGRGSAFPIHVDDVVDLLVTCGDPSGGSRTDLQLHARSRADVARISGPLFAAGRSRQLAGDPAGAALPARRDRHAVSRRLQHGARPARSGRLSCSAKSPTRWRKRAICSAGRRKSTSTRGIASCVPWLREQGLLS